MPARFTILASGSSGNAALLEFEGFGLLIDFGLPPQVIAERLSAVGSSWKAVSAALLTHTHGDHWNAYTLAHLRALQIPLIAHLKHHDELSARKSYAPLREAKLVRQYEAGRWCDLAPGFAFLPVRVPHDSDPTFAFRFDGPGWAVGYASDLGEVPKGLADAFQDVDVLAIEFNHDVAMQKASGRSRMLIDRVLGERGHLSNDQAAAFAKEVDSNLQWLVQLHLSRDCNEPAIAAKTGRAAVPGAQVVTASQDRPTKPIAIESRDSAIHRPRGNFQPVLPGIQQV